MQATVQDRVALWCVGMHLMLTGYMFVLTGLVGAHDPGPIVALPDGGAVRGVWEDGVAGGLAGFRGIPFAEPAVGVRRWKPSVAKAPWRGEWNATADGPICVQYSYSADGPASSPSTTGYRDPPLQSEDCLTLNVFTLNLPGAASSSSSVPVLFWIYGGGNTGGYASAYNNLPDWVTMSGGAVVVVAPNYRVGALGFMALDVLSAADPRGVSGNYGLTDLVLALQWVRHNIAPFGGDPARVTLFGQSSGGTNIFALLSAPSARGLFHGAISLSGSVNLTMALRDAVAQNADFLANTGCADGGGGAGPVVATSSALPHDNDSDVLACLLALSADAVQRATPESWAFLPSQYPRDPSGWQWVGIAIVDGVTVAAPFMDAIAVPIVDVPLLVQSLSNEGDFWRNVTADALSAAEYVQYMRELMAEGWGDAAVDTVAATYSALIAANRERADTQMLSDMAIGCPNQLVAAVASAHFASPVYVSYVTVAPTHPYPLFAPQYTARYPFHVWDYIAASRAWDQYGAYVPAAADVAFGDGVRRAILEFALYEGRIASGGWRMANDTAVPNSGVVVNVLSAANGSAVATEGWLAAECAMWQSVGFGPGSWWSN